MNDVKNREKGTLSAVNSQVKEELKDQNHSCQASDPKFIFNKVTPPIHESGSEREELRLP